METDRSIIRKKSDEFLRSVKEDWKLLWREKYDDKFRGEGVAVRDYPLLFVERGAVIFANRDAKIPILSEILNSWTDEGCIYAPDPRNGGWGKFVRTYLAKSHKKSTEIEPKNSSKKNPSRGRQLKKGGRGWLHIE
ncbi:MAG: hypothetical protein QXN87_05335 [Candidatus Bathyarchaeia archaeon]